ncbi:MAG: hypothetical protein ACYDB4_17045 [Candidatus Dormibacteraceae bacterium]
MRLKAELHAAADGLVGVAAFDDPAFLAAFDARTRAACRALVVV